jgi:anti-sigma factor RsiW
MTVRTRPSARCRKLLLELSRYLDGDLTPARRRQVEQHVGACECCVTMAMRLRRTVAACRAEGRRRPPRAVMSRAAARIRALIAKSEQRPRDVARAQSARDKSGNTARVSHNS